MDKIIEVFIRDGRFYVRLEASVNGRTIVPRANYVWLKGNPSFTEIPAGYVIHHLDLDPLNDDISNLALMAKYHHTAYHWKHKNIFVPVVIEPEFGVPDKMPKIYEREKRNDFCVRYSIKVDGRYKEKWLYSFDGKKFRTREDAENACRKLWPHLFESSRIM